MQIPLPATGSVLVFTTRVCPYCTTLFRKLKAAEIPFEQIDANDEPEYNDFIKSVNNGNRTVPTVVFSDGSTATNPNVEEVRRGIAAASSRSTAAKPDARATMTRPADKPKTSGTGGGSW